MPGATYPIVLDIGTTLRLGFVPKYESTVNGEKIREPYDLTGVTFEFLVRDARRTTIMDFTDEVTIDGDGMIRIHLTPEQTSLFSAHRHYYYTVDMTFSSGDKKRVLEGPIRPRPGFVGSRRQLGD